MNRRELLKQVREQQQLLADYYDDRKRMTTVINGLNADKNKQAIAYAQRITSLIMENNRLKDKAGG